MYDKKIAYLHYMKNNELMGNAGHVKIMLRGGSMSMEIFVRDMQQLPGGYYPLKALGESSFADKIHMERGQAVYKRRLDVDKSGKEELPYGIRIEINDKEYLEAIWQNGKQDTGIKAVEAAEKSHKVVQQESEEREVVEAVSGEEEKWAKKKAGTEWKIGAEKLWETEELRTFSVPAEVYEDKWKELCKKYDVVHPFGNREEYISIAPKDFIIFPEKYQNLVNNSFLLHGYYNYQHIILGKKEEGGKNVYYLGVPGVYYEREKMVAIMFGFEGFECGNKKANNGGFGYYMRRVEL